jgi:hypothetical protein
MGLPRTLLNLALRRELTHKLFQQPDLMDMVLGYTNANSRAIRPIKRVRRSARLKRPIIWPVAVDTHESDESWSSADSYSSSQTSRRSGGSDCESDGILGIEHCPHVDPQRGKCALRDQPPKKKRYARKTFNPDGRNVRRT